MNTPARRLPLLTDKRLWATLALLAVPLVAEANAGTPLMWMGFLHLFVGNALIGVIEGLLMGIVFRSAKWKAIGIMVAANYFSAWIGYVLILPPLRWQVTMTFENAMGWVEAFMALAFIVTLVLELPWVYLYFCWVKAHRRFKKAVFATLLVNVVSYLLLWFGFYGGISDMSLVRDLEQVPVSELNLPSGYVLYYLAKDGTTVMRSGLDGEGAEEVATIEPLERKDEMGIAENEDGSVDLVVPSSYGHVEPDQRIIIPDIEPRLEDGSPPAQVCHPVYRYWQKNLVKGWQYSVGWWAGEGIRGSNESTGERFDYRFNNPFFQWYLYSATVINDGMLVFGLQTGRTGVSDICILDPVNKKIAVVARGSFPVVARGVSGVEQTDDTGH